jgi:hypothetical protein
MNDTAQGDKVEFDSLYDSDTSPGAVAPGAPWVEANGGTDQAAFIVRNRSGQTLDIQIGLNTDDANPGAKIFLQGAATKIKGASDPDDPSTVDSARVIKTDLLDLDDPTDGQSGPKEALSFNNTNDPNEAIPSGHSIYVSLQIDTRSGESKDGLSLSEQLVVGANQAADPGVE